jgi:hypothetical protein
MHSYHGAGSGIPDLSGVGSYPRLVPGFDHPQGAGTEQQESWAALGRQLCEGDPGLSSLRARRDRRNKKRRSGSRRRQRRQSGGRPSARSSRTERGARRRVKEEGVEDDEGLWAQDDEGLWYAAQQEFTAPSLFCTSDMHFLRPEHQPLSVGAHHDEVSYPGADTSFRDTWTDGHGVCYHHGPAYEQTPRNTSGVLRPAPLSKHASRNRRADLHKHPPARAVGVPTAVTSVGDSAKMGHRRADQEAYQCVEDSVARITAMVEAHRREAGATQRQRRADATADATITAAMPAPSGGALRHRRRGADHPSPPPGRRRTPEPSSSASLASAPTTNRLPTVVSSELLELAEGSHNRHIITAGACEENASGAEAAEEVDEELLLLHQKRPRQRSAGSAAVSEPCDPQQQQHQLGGGDDFGGSQVGLSPPPSPPPSRPLSPPSAHPTTPRTTTHPTDTLHQPQPRWLRESAPLPRSLQAQWAGSNGAAAAAAAQLPTQPRRAHTGGAAHTDNSARGGYTGDASPWMQQPRAQQVTRATQCAPGDLSEAELDGLSSQLFVGRSKCTTTTTREKAERIKPKPPPLPTAPTARRQRQPPPSTFSLSSPSVGDDARTAQPQQLGQGTVSPEPEPAPDLSEQAFLERLMRETTAHMAQQRAGSVTTKIFSYGAEGHGVDANARAGAAGRRLSPAAEAAIPVVGLLRAGREGAAGSALAEAERAAAQRLQWAVRSHEVALKEHQAAVLEHSIALADALAGNDGGDDGDYDDSPPGPLTSPVPSPSRTPSSASMAGQQQQQGSGGLEPLGTAGRLLHLQRQGAQLQRGEAPMAAVQALRWPRMADFWQLT